MNQNNFVFLNFHSNFLVNYTIFLPETQKIVVIECFHLLFASFTHKMFKQMSIWIIPGSYLAVTSMILTTLWSSDCHFYRNCQVLISHYIKCKLLNHLFELHLPQIYILYIYIYIYICILDLYTFKFFKQNQPSF